MQIDCKNLPILLNRIPSLSLSHLPLVSGKPTNVEINMYLNDISTVDELNMVSK